MFCFLFVLRLVESSGVEIYLFLSSFCFVLVTILLFFVLPFRHLVESSGLHIRKVSASLGRQSQLLPYPLCFSCVRVYICIPLHMNICMHVYMHARAREHAHALSVSLSLSLSLPPSLALVRSRSSSLALSLSPLPLPLPFPLTRVP